MFAKRLDTNLLCHQIKKYLDSAVHTSDKLRIYFFHSGEQIQKRQDSMLNLPDVYEQKLYSEKKKL